MDIAKLLNPVDCACGRTHTCDMKYVFVESNACLHLPQICQGYDSILIVADENTYRVGGEKVVAQLTDKTLTKLIFPGTPLLIPDERAIEAVEQRLAGIQLIIGIGSGVIQDLCKYVSFHHKLPYYIVATAPSMDGYASSGAAMITDGMKVTYSAKVPEGIIADTEIIKDAPMEMIQAGYGDIIGKYSALNDWKLSHLVNDEYFCDYIYDLTYQMLTDTLPLAQKLLNRDEESIKTLTEALIVVGIAMANAGNSRPASGSEHHFSHFFEITGIINNEPYLAHGIDVVLSTYITALIREKLANADYPATQFVMEEAIYKENIARVYKEVADGCIALQEKVGHYKKDRISIYRAKEKAIKAVLKEMPSAAEIKEILDTIGLSFDLMKETYSAQKLKDAVVYAKDLKDRYTVLWMYYDIFGTKELTL